MDAYDQKLKLVINQLSLVMGVNIDKNLLKSTEYMMNESQLNDRDTTSPHNAADNKDL
jgi:hypothetical protein